jgi:hypothetical protein
LSLFVDKPETRNYRLPRDLLPLRYDIKIHPYFKPQQMPEFFKGAVSINFTCTKETNKLVLHMKEIDLDNSTLRISSLTDRGFSTIEKFAWSYDPLTHFFVARVDTSFKQDQNYTFSVEYKGYTKYDELGFYRSFYWDTNNSKRFEKKIQKTIFY